MGCFRFEIAVANKSGTTGRFILRMLGGPEKLTDAAVISIVSGETVELTQEVQVPAGFPGGRHELHFQLLSSDKGEICAQTSCHVDVPATDDFSIRVIPRTLHRRRGGRVRIQIRNRGQDNQNFNLDSETDSKELGVVLESDQVKVEGHSRTLVHGKVKCRARLFGGTTNVAYSVVAHCGGRPVYGTANFRQKPIFSNGPRALGIVVLLMSVFTLSLLYLFRPDEKEETELVAPSCGGSGMGCADAGSLLNPPDAPGQISIPRFEIIGRIILGDSSPASGSVVSYQKLHNEFPETGLTSESASSDHQNISVGRDGEFVVPSLSSSDSYELLIRKEGHRELSLVVSQVGGTLNLGDLTLYPKVGRLEVKFVDERDGTSGLGGVKLKLFSDAETLFGETYNAPEELGEFVFDDLATPAQYVLEATKDGYFPIVIPIELSVGEDAVLNCDQESGESNDEDPFVPCQMKPSVVKVSGVVKLVAQESGPLKEDGSIASTLARSDRQQAAETVQLTMNNSAVSLSALATKTSDPFLVEFEFADVPIPSGDDPYLLIAEAIGFLRQEIRIDEEMLRVSRERPDERACDTQSSWNCIFLVPEFGSVEASFVPAEIESDLCTTDAAVYVSGGEQSFIIRVPVRPTTVTGDRCFIEVPRLEAGSYLIKIIAPSGFFTLGSCEVQSGSMCRLET